MATKNLDPIWADGHKSGIFYCDINEAMEECAYEKGTPEYDMYHEGVKQGVADASR